MGTNTYTVTLDTGEACTVNTYWDHANNEWRVECPSLNTPTVTGETPEAALTTFVTQHSDAVKASEDVPSTVTGAGFSAAKKE